MLKELVIKVKGNISKVAFGVATTGALAMTSVIAHADTTGGTTGGGDITAVTGQITTALSDSKTQFMTALGAVVAVGVGFFIVKFIVKQVINYFAKVASKG